MEPAYGQIHIGKFHSIMILTGVIIAALMCAIYVSVVNIPGNEVGIVEKKFGGGTLPDSRILAVNGENGIQAQTLAPGWHFFYWPWQYKIARVPVTEIKNGHIGLIQAADGRSLANDTIYAPEWDDPNKMQNAAYFLSEGKGYKGPQLTVLKPGKYRLNTKLFTITYVPVTNMKVGTVGVVKSNVGETIQTENRLVAEGQRGIWDKPLTPREYYLNTKAYEITVISTRQVKVSYTAEIERGERGAQPMRPITVRSKDGFTFPVDVRVTYLIKGKDAPRVVASVGDDELVLTKLVTPTVRAIFRNNAEKVKALQYVQSRSIQEQQSFAMLTQELDKYGITVLAVRIGDVGDEQSLGTLLKTQTDREIALQEQETFQEQQRAAEQQKNLSKTRQEATEEMRLATAAYSVRVAEQGKKQIIINAEAEAEQIKLLAEAQAEAYQLISKVIGPSNAALLEVMKLVATNHIGITPQVMVSSESGGITNALMGTILKDMLDTKMPKK